MSVDISTVFCPTFMSGMPSDCQTVWIQIRSNVTFTPDVTRMCLQRIAPSIVFRQSQWLSGRVLDSRPNGRDFEPHWRHCVVSLSKTHKS